MAETIDKPEISDIMNDAQAERDSESKYDNNPGGSKGQQTSNIEKRNFSHCSLASAERQRWLGGFCCLDAAKLMRRRGKNMSPDDTNIRKQLKAQANGPAKSSSADLTRRAN